MVTLTAAPTLHMKATLQIGEKECRALDALIGYGGVHLVEAVKAHLGTAYIDGNEKTVAEFCDELRAPLKQVLGQFDAARKVFNPSPLTRD